MDKSNKELAIQLLAAYIQGMLEGENGHMPEESDLENQYKKFLTLVKRLPD